MKALLICLLCIGIAHAETPAEEQAHAHFRQGRAYVEAKVYDKAIEEFDAAYKLAPLPDLIFNIAQAYRLAGDPDRAVDAYKRYLAAQSSGEEADESRAHVAELSKIIDARNAQNAAVLAEQRRQAELMIQQDQATRASVEQVRQGNARGRKIGWVVAVVSAVLMVGGFYEMVSGISNSDTTSTNGMISDPPVGAIILGSLVGTLGLTGTIVGFVVVAANPDPPPLPPLATGAMAPGTMRGPSLSWRF